MSKIFGINQTQIYPVRNYSNQTDVETEIDILILTVARQIVRNSQDFLLDKLERKEVEKKNFEKKMAEMKRDKKREGQEKVAAQMKTVMLKRRRTILMKRKMRKKKVTVIVP